jgi:O-antigen/teichoic acid export membrane protein
MLVIMTVSLYTVRVVLKALGIIDYGIYNVIGGLVSMFAVLSSTMASASQRFFSFELGKENSTDLNKIFSLNILFYAIIAVVLVVVAESFGLWFVQNKLSIPKERMSATLWVYQFSVFSFFLTLVTIPYNAIIIAKERMGVYAGVSIIEAFLKLLIVFILVDTAQDKLKLYAMLVFLVTFVITFIYRYYCKTQFVECKYKFYWDKSIFIDITSFSSWKLMGSFSGIMTKEGVNVLLNIFYGPTINAAQGIAAQVNNALQSFSSNFYMAVKPQIIKSYAIHDLGRIKSLVFWSSRLSFYLLLILMLPIIYETNYILKLWLTETSEYMVVFLQLIMVYTLINSFETPLTAVVQSTGKIKKYEIVISLITVVCIPFGYFLFKFYSKPELIFYLNIILALLALVFRIVLVGEVIKLSLYEYFYNVLIKITIVTFASIIVPTIIHISFEESFFRFLATTFSSIISVVISVYFFGLLTKEKEYIRIFIRQFLLKLNSKLFI